MAAASRLLNHFAQGDVEGYFACFAPEATFVFHSVPERFPSTQAYREAWYQWVKDLDLQILGCDSFEQEVHLIAPEVALFVHCVRVHASTRAGKETRNERETIVFARQKDGRWLGMHEHLSRNPVA